MTKNNTKNLYLFLLIKTTSIFYRLTGSTKQVATMAMYGQQQHNLTKKEANYMDMECGWETL